MLNKCNYYLLTLTAFYLECSVFDLFLITDTLYLLQQQNVKDDANTRTRIESYYRKMRLGTSSVVNMAVCQQITQTCWCLSSITSTFMTNFE